MKRRASFIALAATLALIVAGCTGVNIVVTFEPNPVVIRPGDTEIEGTVSVKITGVGVVRIDSVSVAALDENEQVVVRPDTEEPIIETVEIGATIPAFGIGRTEKVTVPVGYDDIKNLGIRTIRITVTGGKTVHMDINIQLVED